MRVTIDCTTAPKKVKSGHLYMGGAAPDGGNLHVNSRYLEKDKKPWLPVMAEFHYARYACGQWREELLKLKTCGITIISTYLFWIHHEEQEGIFDFTQDRNVRSFIKLCDELGLYCLVRIGPWSHGECRNGGFPDWLVRKGIALRSGDSAYLGYVQKLFAQYSDQLSGLWYGDGGNIIGVQIENELTNDSDHLLALKRMAIESGMTAPLYTVTGWGHGIAEFPAGEVLPVFGGYPEAPWEQHGDAMPPNPHYFFTSARNDSTIGSDQIAGGSVHGEEVLQDYPYMTCEMGPGVQVTYHRRPVISPMDVYAMSVVELGSGNNLPGYYVFHGGRNPVDGFYQESKDSDYPNDLPVSSYDFQAPIGEYGFLRPSYWYFKRLHQWIANCGEDLAPMPAYFPHSQPANFDDVSTPRYAVRSDGQAGYLFVNSYQRGSRLDDIEHFSVDIRLQEETITFPRKPFLWKSGLSVIFPFNLQYSGITVRSITAQLLFDIMDNDGRTVFFTAIDDIPVQLELCGHMDSVKYAGDTIPAAQSSLYMDDLVPGKDCVIEIQTAEGCLRLIILDEWSGLHLYKGDIDGQAYALWSEGAVMLNAGGFTLSGEGEFSFGLYPDTCEPVGMRQSGRCGIFAQYECVNASRPATPAISLTPVQQHMIDASNPYAKYLFADPAKCPEYRLEVQEDALDSVSDIRLQWDVQGDVLQIYADGQLLADEFIRGETIAMGLRRFESAIRNGQTLLVKCSPMGRHAVIFLEREVRRDEVSVQLVSIEPIIHVYVQLTINAEQ